MLTCLLACCFLQVELSPSWREVHEAQGVEETNKDQEVSQAYKIQKALPEVIETEAIAGERSLGGWSYLHTA